MSKKMKGVALFEDAKARLKHQTLLQDYQDLQKETDVMSTKLQTAKQRKQILAAEVWFLRKRYKYLLETKLMNSPQEQQIVQPPSYMVNNSSKKNKDHMFIGKEAKKKNIGKEAVGRTALRVMDIEHKQKLRSKKEDTQRASTPSYDINNRGRISIRKEPVMRKKPLVIDLNEKERVCGANDNTVLRNSFPGFDLNEESNSGKEVRLQSRAPIFDLNEISTGDEDFHNYESLKLDDARKGLIRGLSEEQHNDLKLSVCRNAGEGSTRVGKRKISWQDPVALRV